MAELREVFIGRQPIVDREQATVGYELLFRAAAEDHARLESAKAATADVVCKAFAELGLATAMGTTRAFVNVDADFLAEDAVGLLPKDRVVLEIEADVLARPGLLERCRALRSEGYDFCLVCRADAGSAGLPQDIPSFFKVAVGGMPPDRVELLVKSLQAARTLIIATRIESEEDRAFAAKLGCQWFQGYYFARPVLIEGRQLDASLQGLLRLIQAVSGDAGEAEIDAAFRTEPALVINLLRLTNSVGIGARSPVSSVRHAIALLGRRQLLRWLQLLLFSRNGGRDIGNNPLMQHAALRGRFMELLAAAHLGERSGQGDSAFIVGMMSLMPAALGLTIDAILDRISVPAEVRGALVSGDEPLGPLLELTLRYDDNDMSGTASAMARLGGSIDHAVLNQCLTDALAWVLRVGKV